MPPSARLVEDSVLGAQWGAEQSRSSRGRGVRLGMLNPTGRSLIEVHLGVKRRSHVSAGKAEQVSAATDDSPIQRCWPHLLILERGGTKGTGGIKSSAAMSIFNDIRGLSLESGHSAEVPGVREGVSRRLRGGELIEARSGRWGHGHGEQVPSLDGLQGDGRSTVPLGDDLAEQVFRPGQGGETSTVRLEESGSGGNVTSVQRRCRYVRRGSGCRSAPCAGLRCVLAVAKKALRKSSSMR
jgi:hypothetical protein